MISKAMEHHHRTRHHHLEVSSGSVSPNGNDELEHESSQVAPSTATAATMNGCKDKCSLSDIWRMSSSAEIASKLVLMTQAPRLCAEMRADGVMPLLVQLLHQHSTEEGMLAIGVECDPSLELGNRSHRPTSEMFRSTLALRRNSAKALRNIVHNTSKSKKEIKILSLLEDLRSFVELLYLKWSELPVDAVDHPCTQLADIFTIACDLECKRIIELLGGVYVIADVIQSDFFFHREANTNDQCFQLRQYSLNILTYLTANNAHVKSLLGSMRPFISVLVETLQQKPQLENAHLIQAVANVLHNLSWKTDFSSKQIMRDAKAVTHLANAAMATKDLTTLKALLEPLLNLTAHCSPNKADFCKVEGALDFLISTLSFTSANASGGGSSASTPPTRNQLAIVENSGGILRNVCSYLVTQDDLMEQLRSRSIIALLLEQLKSPSLAIVSNACITLSHLSRSPVDQRKMKELGALQMLHSLTSSKHEMIKLGASKTLHNLLTSHIPPNYGAAFNEMQGMSTSFSIPSSLHLRKFKAFKTELSNCMTENYDAILGEGSPNSSPQHTQTLNRSANCKSYTMNMMCANNYANGTGLAGSSSANFHKVTRSSSHDSIGSTHSEPGSKMLRSAPADHKSAAVAALMNLANNSSPHDQRMISSYSGQTMNSIYATLPANSRICDNKLSMDSAADASDYDISCSDIIGLNNSISHANGSFAELEADPAPTDYSQRFAEQSIDDYTAPSSSKNENSCEDTVKVYQTENTPLAISLAPSLSDLRDLSDGKHASGYSARGDDGKGKMADLSERFNSMELSKPTHDDKQQQQQLFKKPIMAPKPPAKFPPSSNSAYNLKNLGSIHEEAAVEETEDRKVSQSMQSYCSPLEGQIKQEELSSQFNRPSSPVMYENYGMPHGAISWASKTPPARWANSKTHSTAPRGIGHMSTPIRNAIVASVNRKADMMEHYVPNDSSTVFATEDTPAQISHATSLSELSVDLDFEASEAEFANAHHEQHKESSQGQPRVSLNSTASVQEGEHNNSSAALESGHRVDQAGSNVASRANERTHAAFPNSAQQQQRRAPSPSQPLRQQMMAQLAGTAPLVKSTPVAAKRMSKAQPPTVSASTVPYYAKHSAPSPPPPRRPPKKPLPPKPVDQSPPQCLAPPPPILPGSTTTQQEGGDDADYDFLLTKCREVALPKASAPAPIPKPPRSSPKGNTSTSASSSRRSPNSKAASTPTPPSNSTAPKQCSPKTDVKGDKGAAAKTTTTVYDEANDADEEDEQILDKCRQVAIKQSTKSSKRSHHSGSNREGKSPRIYTKNPAASNATPSANHHLTRAMNRAFEAPTALPPDQEKHFFVEDTPVQFSQCHSPLSALFDSGDEVVDDRRLVEAAEHFDAYRSSQAVPPTEKPAATYPELSENESESASTATATLTMVASSTHVRQTGKSIAAGHQPTDQRRSETAPVPATASAAGGSVGAVSTGYQQQPDGGTTSATTERNTASQIGQRQSSMEDADDDEKTYTICTQDSRLSSATLTTGASAKPLSTSAMGASDNSSGSMLDLEMVQPPSLIDDSNLMFSSTETNMARSGPRSVPNSRAASARVRRAEANQLGGELHAAAHRQASSFEHSPAHSLLEDQKPPSIMEHSSLMSQSTASITSEISDFALDHVPVRQSSTDQVAELASSYAKELSNLADLCLNGSAEIRAASSASQSVSMSSSASNSRRLAVNQSTDDLLLEQRADRTFDMEPTPNSRTLPRNSSGTSGTTTVTVARAASNTRTYNKTDRTKTHTTDKTLEAGQVAALDLADSDTDISEVLPLDDVKSVRESAPSRQSRHSPTKRTQPAQSMPQYSNPMESPAAEKKPPPAPRYKPRPQLAPANFELTDDESSDDDRLPIGYSHSLNNRRSARSSRKNSARDDTASVQLDFSGMRFGSFSSDLPPELGQTAAHSAAQHSNLAFHSLGRRGYGPGKIRLEKDFEDKELLFTAQHKNTVLANHAQFFQSKSNSSQPSIKTASKYFDRHAAALSSMAHEDLHQQTNADGQSTTGHSATSHVPLPTSTFKRSSSNEPAKGKSSSKSGGGKEKGTSLFAKFSSSFSSHNLGAHANNNSGGSSPVTPSSSKNSFNKINSKIASLWKRSKSTHDKLDHEALTANPGKNMKAAELNRTIQSKSKHYQPQFDVNQNQANLTRSSTYEKLPANEEEAARMSRLMEGNNNNNCNCAGESTQSEDKFDCTGHLGRTTASRYPNDQQAVNGNFTFTTFVKSHSSTLGSSFESVSTQSSVDRAALSNSQSTVLNSAAAKGPLPPSGIASQPANANGPVEDSSGFSSASSASNQPARKTCLVTTV